MNVTDCIECPKCHKPFLKQINQDWYCHKCHTDFTTHELVYQWGLDAGDLYGEILDVKKWVNSLVEKFPYCQSYFVESEPEWATEYERENSYQMVTRMLLDIPEFDDYADMLATHEDALGIGVQ